VQPEPLQQPHPPLWVAATTPAAAERAGRHGAHLAAASVEPELYAAYRRGLASSGCDPASRRVGIGFAVTTTWEDPERVWERQRELAFYRWDFYRRIRSELGDPALRVGLERGGASGPPESPTPESYRANELIAPPERVLEIARERVEQLGLTDFVLLGPAPGVDLRGEGYRSVKLFAERVLPALKQW
jgi:alkanesulfonate monooxygenase SsuD/methylene tetrahydromethanopterin reductase-like flavin-dependent oxidoreductase (luciferase family)